MSKKGINLTIGGTIVLGALCLSAWLGADWWVRGALSDRGMAWDKVDRSGLQWKFKGLRGTGLEARSARLTLTLALTPRLEMRAATVDLQAITAAEDLGSILRALPQDLYLSVDPLTLSWGDVLIASGLRTRMDQGVLRATGPTLTIEGEVGDTVTIKLSGELALDSISANGILEVALSNNTSFSGTLKTLQIEPPVLGTKLVFAQAPSFALSGIDGELTGDLTMGDAKAAVTVRCDGSKDASNTTLDGCVVSATATKTPLEPAIQSLLATLDDLDKAALKGKLDIDASLSIGKPFMLDMTYAVASTTLDNHQFGLQRLRDSFKVSVPTAGGVPRWETLDAESPGWLDGTTLPLHVRAALVAGSALAVLVSAERLLPEGRGTVRTTRAAAGDGKEASQSVAAQVAQAVVSDIAESMLRSGVNRLAVEAALRKQFSDDELLTLMVNVTAWGPEVLGLTTASDYYFGVEPAELSLRQSAMLAALLASPLELHQQWHRDGQSPTDAINAVLDSIGRQGTLDAAVIEEARSARLVTEQG